jgi:hypothetical protein
MTILLFTSCFSLPVLVFQPQRSPESLVEGVLGAEAWVDGVGDNVSKLYLKREDREGVEGTVRTESHCQRQLGQINGVGMLT